jgi:hypothetical protein
MLIDPKNIKPIAAPIEEEPSKVQHLDRSQYEMETVADILEKPKQLGKLIQGKDKHFYSNGGFNLIQLMLYVLKQTGPADIFLSTYSIAEDSVTTLRRYVDQGKIRSIRFLIDNRVRSISPKPFAHLIASFPDEYRCTALHAKVACISNDEWHVSIVGSQNATHNPKLERGIIHTSREIWDFDNKILNDEFNQGTK